MGIEHREQLRRGHAALHPLGEGRMAGNGLPEGRMGDGQRHQIRRGQQDFPVHATAELRPAHHRAGFQALQGGHPLGEARRHHHRAGRALQQKEGLGWGLLQAADRLAQSETQQLPLSSQGPQQGFRLVGQEGKGAKQIEDLIRIGHDQVASLVDSGAATRLEDSGTATKVG